MAAYAIRRCPSYLQAPGEAIFGALEGTQLSCLSAQQITLAGWRALHPDSLVAAAAPDAPKGRIPEKALHKMLRVTNHFMGPGFTNLGNGWHVRETIFALTRGGVSRAYPVTDLARNLEFSYRLGNEVVSMQFISETGEIRAQNQAGGALPMQSHWWFGWKEFHPLTDIWLAPDPTG